MNPNDLVINHIYIYKNKLYKFLCINPPEYFMYRICKYRFIKINDPNDREYWHSRSENEIEKYMRPATDKDLAKYL